MPAATLGVLMLYTSHWRSALLADVVAVIVGISRGTPRGNSGFRYRVLRSLAPSREAFALEDQQEFEQVYLRQLEGIGAQAILDRLEDISGGRDVVMLCWERPTDAWCHRWTLARWLEERTGIEIRELTPGDLPRRPDAPQQSLF